MSGIDGELMAGWLLQDSFAFYQQQSKHETGCLPFSHSPLIYSLIIIFLFLLLHPIHAFLSDINYGFIVDAFR